MRHLTMAQPDTPIKQSSALPSQHRAVAGLLHPWSRVAPQHAHSWGRHLGVPLEHSRLQAQHSLLPRAHSRSLPRGAPSTPCLIYVGSETTMKRSWGVLWHSGGVGEVANAHGRV